MKKPWLKRIIWAILIAALAFSGWRGFNGYQQKKAALQAARQGQNNTTAIDVQASDLLLLDSRSMRIELAIAGTIRAVNSAMVKARVAGELQALQVREGQAVRPGQLLGQIDAADYIERVRQARAQAQAAQAQLELNSRLHQNNQALLTRGFISSTALAASQTNLDTAQANHDATQAALAVANKALTNTKIKAPIAGLVSQRLAQPGEQLAADAPVIRIVDLSQLELQAELDGALALQVRLSQTAQLHLPGLAQPITARVVRINPSASPASRAVPVYLAIDPDSSAGLRDGLFAQGTLTVGQQDALALPLDAVHTELPQPYIQIIDNDVVRNVQVKPGIHNYVDGQTLVAIEGAKAGMRVILSPVGVLRPGTPVRVVTTAEVR